MVAERVQYPHGCSRVQHPDVSRRDAISLCSGRGCNILMAAEGMQYPHGCGEDAIFSRSAHSAGPGCFYKLR